MQRQRKFPFIELPKIFDDCFLSFAQIPHHIPFNIKRIYYITQANPKLPRGYHAHKKTKQVIFCIQGKVNLILDNGKRKRKILLDQSHVGVFIDKMIWHVMEEFEKNTILLVLASRIFNPSDYIRDYESFKKASQIS